MAEGAERVAQSVEPLPVGPSPASEPVEEQRQPAAAAAAAVGTAPLCSNWVDYLLMRGGAVGLFIAAVQCARMGGVVLLPNAMLLALFAAVMWRGTLSEPPRRS